MTKVDVVVREEEVREGHPLLGFARRALMLGLGTAALALEQVEAFAEQLVDRGQAVERGGRKLVNEAVGQRRHRVRRLVDKGQESIEGGKDDVELRLEQILRRMNVPTRTDVEALSTKLTALIDKIDELKKGEEE